MKVLILDENPATGPIVNYTLRSIIHASRKIEGGLEIKLTPVGGAPLESVLAKIKEEKPDALMWTITNMNHILKDLPEHILKLVMWHDDPMMRLVGTKSIPDVTNIMAGGDYIHLVGDSEWGEWLLKNFGFSYRWFPLAYDPDEFPQCKKPITDDVVFVGTLQSPYHLANGIEALPPLPKAMCLEAKMFYENRTLSEGKTPDIHEVCNILPHAKIWKEYCASHGPGVMAAFNIIWSLAKNCRRIAALKAALKQSPVRIFSEMKQHGHANMWEIRAMLGEWGKRLAICDTSGLPPQSLYQCYQYGKVHLDICDSQNKKNGFAYRYFQTVGSGRPLIVDALPEHHKVFDTNHTLKWETSEFCKELPFIIPGKIECDAMEWRDSVVGKRYTWEYRIKELEQIIKEHQEDN